MSVADEPSAASLGTGRPVNPVESIELALRLGDDDVALFCAVHGCSAAEARAVFRRTRSADRRPSVANETGRS